jgi:hypothetical protein
MRLDFQIPERLGLAGRRAHWCRRSFFASEKWDLNHAFEVINLPGRLLVLAVELFAVTLQPLFVVQSVGA